MYLIFAPLNTENKLHTHCQVIAILLMMEVLSKFSCNTQPLQFSNSLTKATCDLQSSDAFILGNYAKISSKISDQQFTIINAPPRFGLSLSLVIVLTKPSDISYHQKNPKSHEKQSQERSNPLGISYKWEKQKNTNNCNPDTSFIHASLASSPTGCKNWI